MYRHAQSLSDESFSRSNARIAWTVRGRFELDADFIPTLSLLPHRHDLPQCGVIIKPIFTSE